MLTVSNVLNTYEGSQWVGPRSTISLSEPNGCAFGPLWLLCEGLNVVFHVCIDNTAIDT